MAALTVERLRIEDLTPFPTNPRRGNLPLIAESLETHGQYKPITVNRRTAENGFVKDEIGQLVVVAGNHTMRAAGERLKWEEIDGTIIEVTRAQEEQIMLIDNRTTDAAEYDMRALAAHLEALMADDALAGTGFTTDDLDDLLAELQELPAGDGPMGTRAMPGGNMEERETSYQGHMVRQIVLTYEGEDYVKINNWLAEARNKRGLASNSEVVFNVMREIADA